MVARRIPGSSRVVYTSNHGGDYVFDMADAPEVSVALKQEDVVILGDWSDWSGSGNVPPQQVMMQGAANIVAWDQIARLNGVHVDNKTPRGANVQTHRQRNRLVYFE